MAPFHVKRKRVGNRLNSGETEREKEGERQSVAVKGFGVGNKLDR